MIPTSFTSKLTNRESLVTFEFCVSSRLAVRCGVFHVPAIGLISGHAGERRVRREARDMTMEHASRHAA
eukprot:6678563-Prymnesium_polylepis.1